MEAGRGKRKTSPSGLGRGFSPSSLSLSLSRITFLPILETIGCLSLPVMSDIVDMVRSLFTLDWPYVFVYVWLSLDWQMPSSSTPSKDKHLEMGHHLNLHVFNRLILIDGSRHLDRTCTIWFLPILYDYANMGKHLNQLAILQ